MLQEKKISAFLRNIELAIIGSNEEHIDYE